MLMREIDDGPIGAALRLLPVGMDTPRARIQILATGLQESGLQERVQRGNGPARGLLQFERGGGVSGVLGHPSTAELARQVCGARGVEPDAQHVWAALSSDDVLAMAFGRLLLWSDPHKLPSDAEGGWQLYLRTWRPGKPRPETWGAHYKRAEDWVLLFIDS